MLTLRQEKFILNYIETGNASKSCVLAGYSPNGSNVTGSQLLAKPNIKAEIDKLKAEIKANRVLDIAERKQKLSQIALETTKNKIGEPVFTNQIQAIAELNRMDQLTDKQPVTINYQAILTRAEEIEKDFIEGKYAIIESQEPRKNEG